MRCAPVNFTNFAPYFSATSAIFLSSVDQQIHPECEDGSQMFPYLFEQLLLFQECLFLPILLAFVDYTLQL